MKTSSIDSSISNRVPARQTCPESSNCAAAFFAADHLKYLVVSFTSDWLYPTYHSKEMVRALTAVGADITYLDIVSSWGHDAFLLEVETMTNLLSSFLDRLVREEKVALP